MPLFRKVFGVGPEGRRYILKRADLWRPCIGTGMGKMQRCKTVVNMSPMCYA